ncbi:MAG TPA: NlpC/P60 family protein [Candidatus Limnocylindrales bacterium]
MSKLRLLLFTFAAALFAVAFQLQSAPPVAAATPAAEVGSVMNFASNQLGKRFHIGATGMRRYDCSGLVYRTFYQEGLLDKIGGSRKRARGYYHWFESRGLASKTNPQVGDLVVWAKHHHPVSHIGIFAGYNRWGQPMAISALVNPYGVSRHRVFGIDKPFKAYLHVNF